MNGNQNLIEEAAATIAVAELVRTHRTWADGPGDAMRAALRAAVLVTDQGENR